MSRRTRRSHRPALKAKIVLEAVKGGLAQKHDVHANQITP